MLKFVYSFFLGLLLVIFVGMGIASFYPAPEPPVYPQVLMDHSAKPNADFTAEEKRLDKQYRVDSDAYNKTSQVYSRTVSIVVLIAAIVLLVISLALHNKITILADGLLLGGTFSLIYSIGRSFASDDPKYSFVVVSVGLVITMIVGYLKFIKPSKPAKNKKK